MREMVRTLKDGYWESTTVVRAPDGSLRVRKESKSSERPGPWARQALQNEISYLRALPEIPRRHFPPLLDWWVGESIGYEIPFYENREDFSRLLLTGRVDQQAADEMQRSLVRAVFQGVHRAPVLQSTGFADHIAAVITDSLQALAEEENFRPLVDEDGVEINGRRYPGLARSLAQLAAQGAFARLESTPAVLLHGDLILENILWPPLLLIDPVSVAGLTSGHPLFDLVKYESYACGELYAIREEHARAGPRGHGQGQGYILEIDYERAELRPFRQVDLLSIFRAGYENSYGETCRRLYALLDGYFSLVMARNTRGIHQWARVIKGCQCLAEAAGEAMFDSAKNAGWK